MTKPIEKKSFAQLLWVFGSYFAEGLPWSVLHQVAAEYFTSINASPSKVGQTALLHIPILLKAVWSPIVESVGTLRQWMVGTLALMGAMVGALAAIAHHIASAAAPQSESHLWIWVLLFSIGVLSAMYDIACDGFYMEELDEREQALLSGGRVAAYRAAMLVGSFLLVFLGGTLDWRWGFGAGALILGLLSLWSWRALPQRTSAVLPERRPEHAARRGRTFSELSAPYLSFVRQDAAWTVIGFLLVYKAADQMMFSMSPILLGRHLGIATELRATIGTVGTFASILGAIWGGAWVARRGLGKALFPITLLMVATEPLYAALAFFAEPLALFVDGAPMDHASFSWQHGGATLSLVMVVSAVEKLCGGFAVAAQTVFIMQRCDKRYRTAHYAFATVVYSIAQIGLGVASGYLFEGLGPTGYYLLVCLIALPALWLARRVPVHAMSGRDGRS